MTRCQQLAWGFRPIAIVVVTLALPLMCLYGLVCYVAFLLFMDAPQFWLALVLVKAMAGWAAASGAVVLVLSSTERRCSRKLACVLGGLACLAASATLLPRLLSS